MTQSREKSPTISPQSSQRAHEGAADGSATESARPDALKPDDVLAAVRHELDQIVVKLGERGVGGTWNAAAEFRFHTAGELESKVGQLSDCLRSKLEEWTGPAASASAQIDVLMHLWRECWELWDRALIYRTLKVAIDATCKFVKTVPSPGLGEPAQDWEREALRAVAKGMLLLDADANVYRETNLSSPRVLADTASKSEEDAGKVLKAVTSVLAIDVGRPSESADSGKIIKSLHDIAEAAEQGQLFYGAIVHAANALACFENWLAVAPRLGPADPEQIGDDPAGPDELRQVLRESVIQALGRLHIAQESLKEPTLGESEPWEQLLIKIRDIVDSPAGQETAKVFVPKRASIRYCYPFAIEPDQEISLERRDELQRDLKAALDSGIEHMSAGSSGSLVGVQEIKRLEPTELFAAQDSVTRLYDGVRIELSGIELKYNKSYGPGGGEQSEKCNVWVDLSRMGNHCLCIQPVNDLKEALPHLLYRALRAGTPFAIGAEVSIADSSIESEATWDSMHLFSRDIIQAIGLAGFWKSENEGSALSAVRGNLHEVVVLRTDGPLDTQIEDVAAKLDLSLGGRILTRSIQRAATSFEEWVRYPPAPRGRGQGRVPAIAPVTEIGLEGDWLTHTGETTIFGIAAAPEWHSDVYLEAGQFASTWSPILRLWNGRLQAAIKISQSAVEKRASGLVGENGDIQEGAMLRSIEGKLRSHLSQIWSEELCATLAHRRFLDQLLEAADLDRLQRELEAQLGSAERMTDYWSERARLERDEEYRRNEEQRKEADSRREALLAVIALFGLFELGTFLTVADATNLFNTTRHHGIWEDGLMLGVFIVGCSLVAIYIIRGRRDKLKGAKQNRRSRGDTP